MGTRWGFIDETGKIAISPKYDAVVGFEGALAPMAVSGRRGYIDRTGAVIREPMDSLPFATPPISMLDEVAPAAAPDYEAYAPAVTDTVAPTDSWSPGYGMTHEVRMYGDERGYRFEPRNLTVRTGDAVRFVFLSGGPHNVAFDGTYLSEMVRRQLDANFSSKMATLSSSMMLNPGEGITVSWANIPAGRYPYNCTPHLVMGMSGVITVLP